MNCINVCPKDALSLSLKWDHGAEKLRPRKRQADLDWLRGLKFGRVLRFKNNLPRLPQD